MGREVGGVTRQSNQAQILLHFVVQPLTVGQVIQPFLRQPREPNLERVAAVEEKERIG